MRLKRLIGMGGMGMDPMMMMPQGMYGSGFNQDGSIPNNMNMGIGFQGWNVSSGMGMGMNRMNGMDGSFGGYYPTGGYNQPQAGNFNPMHQQQYQNNSFNPTRFRGSSNHRRGKNYGYQHGGGGQYDSRNAWREQSGHIDQQFSGNQQDRKGSDTQAIQTGQQATKEDEKDGAEAVSKPDVVSTAEEGNVAVKQSTENLEAAVDQAGGKLSEVENDSKHAPLESIRTDDPKLSDHPSENVADDLQRSNVEASDSVERQRNTTNVEGGVEPLDNAGKSPATLTIKSPEEPSIPQGPAAQFATPPAPYRGRGLSRGLSRGGRAQPFGATPRQSFGAGMSIAAPTPATPGVIGAPSGPKAMREGHAGVNFRGRGGSQMGARGGAVVGTPGTPSSAISKPPLSSAK